MVDSLYSRTFSIDEAFGFSSLFLNELWKKSIKPRLLAEQDLEAFENHGIFCNFVCGNPRSSPEWLAAVSSVTNLDREALKEDRISLQEVFPSMVEYCRIFHEKWNAKLQFVFDVLMAMGDDSSAHLPDGSLLQEAVHEFQLARSDFVTTSPRHHCHMSWDPVNPLPPFKRDILGAAFTSPVSIEDAHSISIMFLMKLKLRPPQSSQAANGGLHMYEYFNLAVCMHEENSHEWFQAVAKVKNILNSEAQAKARFTPLEIFLCTIEFCKMFNEEFNGELQDLVDLLEAMRAGNRSCFRQWACWQEAIFKYYRGMKVPLDWHYWPQEAVASHQGAAVYNSSSVERSKYWQIRGHFSTDIPYHQECMLQAVSRRENLIGIKFDEDNTVVEFYTTFLTEGPYIGCQVWVEAAHGEIMNGGLNYVPKSWHTDLETNFGGQSVILKYLPMTQKVSC